MKFLIALASPAFEINPSFNLLPNSPWYEDRTSSMYLPFLSNLKHLKRTDFHIRVGEPFKLDPGGERVTKEVRQQMVDEMMYRMAAMLPEYYRGAYADLENATEKYLVPI